MKLQSFFYSILKCLFVQTFSLKEYASSFVAIFGISFSFNNGAKESVIKLLPQPTIPLSRFSGSFCKCYEMYVSIQKTIQWNQHWNEICNRLINSSHIFYTVCTLCENSSSQILHLICYHPFKEWVSDWCLAQTQQFFSVIMARTSSFSMRWWWGPLCTRPTWFLYCYFTETTVCR
jgi:hypothetical protein